MALSIGKGLLYALSGAAKGAEKAAKAEDEKRDELSKAALESALKRKESALAMAKELKEKSEGQQRFMQAYAGQQVGEAKISRAEALRLYEITGGDDTKVPDAIKDGLIKISGAGDVKEITSTEGGIDTEDMAIEESKGLFSGGRAEGVKKRVEAGMEARGISADGVTMPTTYQATGVQVGDISNTTEGDRFEQASAGTWSWTDEQGNTQTAQGFLDSKTGERVIWDSESGDYVPAPATANFQKATTRTESVPTYEEAIAEIGKLIEKPTRDAMVDVSEKAKGFNLLKDNYERLADLALDANNYPRITEFVGNLVKNVELEISGIKFLAGEEGNVQRDSSYWMNQVSEINKTVNALSGAKDVASNQKLMEAMALRMAINDLVSSGDSRPSDFDVRSRLKMYLAKSPEEFIKQAEQNLANARSQFNESTRALQSMGGFALVKGLAEDPKVSPTSRDAAAALVSAYTQGSKSVLEEPAFVTQYREIKAKEQEVKEPEQTGGITTTLNIKGTEREVTFDPKTRTFTMIVKGAPMRLKADRAIQDGYITAQQVAALTGE